MKVATVTKESLNQQVHRNARHFYPHRPPSPLYLPGLHLSGVKFSFFYQKHKGNEGGSVGEKCTDPVLPVPEKADFHGESLLYQPLPGGSKEHRQTPHAPVPGHGSNPALPKTIPRQSR